MQTYLQNKDIAKNKVSIVLERCQIITLKSLQKRLYSGGGAGSRIFAFVDSLIVRSCLVSPPVVLFLEGSSVLFA